MSFIALYDLDMISVDAKKFFTQNNLRERVYCEQMEGHVQGGYLPDGRPKKVCLLVCQATDFVGGRAKPTGMYMLCPVVRAM